MEIVYSRVFACWLRTYYSKHDDLAYFWKSVGGHGRVHSHGRTLFGQRVSFVLFLISYRVGGNLFSSAISKSPSVGASTAIMGILTGALAMLFVNWQAFNGS